MLYLTEALDGNKLSDMSKETFKTLADEFYDNDKRISELEKRLKAYSQKQ